MSSDIEVSGEQIQIIQEQYPPDTLRDQGDKGQQHRIWDIQPNLGDQREDIRKIKGLKKQHLYPNTLHNILNPEQQLYPREHQNQQGKEEEVEQEELNEEPQPSQDFGLSASQALVRRRRLIPPSAETMRHSIADNLMEILVNMTHPQYQSRCFELLQVSDALQARTRILAALQSIDESRPDLS